MSRLIDADDFKKFLQALCKSGAPYENVIQLLDKQPTAYDIEKNKKQDNNYCKWEATEDLRKKGICYSSDGLYKPSCNNYEDDFRDWNWIRHFKFCPYCGKRIEVVE